MSGREAVVVGAGIIGLTTAVCLLEDGWYVRVVAAEPPERTMSAVAAAIWHPGAGGGGVLGWAGDSYAVYTTQAEAAEAPGVLVRRGWELLRSRQSDPEWAPIVGGVVRPGPELLPAGYVDAFEFNAPIVEMTVYLAWLVDRLNESGGEIEVRSVPSLEELEGTATLVVNCAGLHGGKLAGDDTLVPVRIQAVRVTNPGLARFLRDDADPGFRTYVYPRSQDCVLGGTAERGKWDLDPDPDAAARIIRRCRALEPALGEAEVIEPLVGLAPWRPAVRVEAEPLSARSGALIHNYGHGGAGVTLAWGCARKVAALARALIGSDPLGR